MAKKFVLKEGTISIAGVQLQIRDGAVNPEDQSPEGMDLLQKIANAVNGGEDVQINLPGQPAAGGIPGAMPPEGAMGEGGPLEPGAEGPPEMGALPPEQESEPHFPGETPEEHEEHEAAESPEEEAAEHAEGESEADESHGAPPKPPKAEKEDEGEEEEEDEDEEGPPKKKGPPEKGKNPFADDINRIAACITEDIDVNNGVSLE
jgi:hypothetical protein